MLTAVGWTLVCLAFVVPKIIDSGSGPSDAPALLEPAAFYYASRPPGYPLYYDTQLQLQPQLGAGSSLEREYGFTPSPFTNVSQVRELPLDDGAYAAFSYSDAVGANGTTIFYNESYVNAPAAFLGLLDQVRPLRPLRGEFRYRC